jgi:multisubunit Na+/H+ antiporter MnhE subunit
VGVISVLVLCGALAWDLVNDDFWLRHTLLTGLVASLIVVAVTAAVVNEVLERRQRERWSVLAQYALFDLLRAARLVWTSLLELAGLVPDEDLTDGLLEAGTEAVRDTPRLAAASTSCLRNPTAASSCTG